VAQAPVHNGEPNPGYDNWTQGWDPAIARQSMDQALTDLDNNVQGVVSSNDGNAAAAIASLDEQGMAGKVPVSGLDGTVQALQLMLLGEQTQSVWRPFDTMADITAQVVARLLAGESVDDLVDGTVENAAGAQIPFVPIPHYSAVGEEGVAYIIENDPSIAKEDVCQGEAAETDFCKS
jgi:D-xylose transport system substrate-binding protein